MEETFISFVSSCFLDGDHDGHNNRTSEEEEDHGEEVGELLCDFVPYAHDGYIPLRDRAFSWDVTLENPIEELIASTAERRETEQPKLVIKTTKKANNSKLAQEDSTRTSLEAKDFDDEKFLDDADIFDETIMVINEGLGISIKKELLPGEIFGESTPSGKSKRKPPAKVEKATPKTPEIKQEKSTKSNKKSNTSGNSNNNNSSTAVTSTSANSVGNTTGSSSITVTAVSSNIVSSGMTSGTLGTTMSLPTTSTALLSGTIVTPVNHSGDVSGRSDSMQDQSTLAAQSVNTSHTSILSSSGATSSSSSSASSSSGGLPPHISLPSQTSSQIQVIPLSSAGNSSSTSSSLLQYPSIVNGNTPGSTSTTHLQHYPHLGSQSQLHSSSSQSLAQSQVTLGSSSGGQSTTNQHSLHSHTLHHYHPSTANSATHSTHPHLSSFSAMMQQQQQQKSGDSNNSLTPNTTSSNIKTTTVTPSGLKVEPVLTPANMHPNSMMQHHHHHLSSHHHPHLQHSHHGHHPNATGPASSITGGNGMPTTTLLGHQGMYKPPLMKSSLTSIMNYSTTLSSGSAGTNGNGTVSNGMSVGPNGMMSSNGMMEDMYRMVSVNGMTMNGMNMSGNMVVTGMSGSSMINDSERRVGQYTIEERRIKIEKFRERKRQRIWRKQIKYDCRKRLADNRPRVKGRFVSRKNLGANSGPDTPGDDHKSSLMGDDGILIGEGSDNDSDGDVESANATMILGDNDMDIPPAMKRSKTCEF